MEPRIIANKYKVVETLYQSDLQNIYIAEDAENFTPDQLIINEILDGSIIHAAREVFNEESKGLLKNFLDYYYKDSVFYIISGIATGTTLDSYLSSNSLRISDKMYIAESLLTQLQKLNQVNRLLKYHFLSLENISVAGNRTISFNLDMKFDKEGLYATAATIISRLGNVLYCIFANTPQATLDQDKDNLPPAIASIVRKCMGDDYSSIEEVHRDFKTSLLYSTFIENSSVDKMIMKNIKKASRKRSLKPFKRIVAVLMIAALLAGGYYAYNNLHNFLPALGFGGNPAAQQNQIPVAKFSMSKSKVYVGDKIDFTSESTDPDISDKVASYEWSVSRNEDVFILFSKEQNPSYVFEEEGEYVVSLIVKDTSGISSAAYHTSFTVFPKEEIPDTTGTVEEGEVILK